MFYLSQNFYLITSFIMNIQPEDFQKNLRAWLKPIKNLNNGYILNQVANVKLNNGLEITKMNQFCNEIF